MLTALTARAVVPVDAELLEELDVTTHFTRDEIMKLHRRFSGLDSGARGAITGSQLFEIPELAHNQMRARLEEMWSSKMAGDITFHDFVTLLAPFARACPRDQKFRFAFAVYDSDGDGKLGEDDLRALIYSLLGVPRAGPEAERDATTTPWPAGRASGTSFGSRGASTTPGRLSTYTSSRADVRGLDSELVDKVLEGLFSEVDFDDDRTLSFEEWVKIVANTDIEAKLSLQL
mmetsp:Transcript_23064/g.59251  ORF Transcript_23064/g.59251 Transcript_23064/m.59251 type:complete len:232 (+) Transcript_23064:90-785(+)